MKRRISRSERQKQRKTSAANYVPYTTRRIGQVSLIDDEAVAIIERNADRILAVSYTHLTLPTKA